MKVLVVDVDIEVRDQLRMGLEAFEGFEVEHAEGLGALDRLRRCKYDGVFLGVDQKSTESIQRIREEHPDLPLLLLGDDALLRRAKQGNPNVQAVLPLPLNAVDFFRSVARMRQRFSAPV